MTGIKSITFEVYEESGDVYKTLKLLTENGLDGWCSPLHHSNHNHYHFVVIRFADTSKGLSYNRWADIVSTVGGANDHFDKCFPHDTSAYLIHDRDKNKEQFNGYEVVQFTKDLSIEDNLGNVISFGAVPDFREYILVHDDRKKMTNASKSNILVDIYKHIKTHNILSYAYLIDWVIDNKIEWFDTCNDYNRQITAYMRSMEYTYKMLDKITRPCDTTSDSEDCRIIELQQGIVPTKGGAYLTSRDIDVMAKQGSVFGER